MSTDSVQLRVQLWVKTECWPQSFVGAFRDVDIPERFQLALATAPRDRAVDLKGTTEFSTWARLTVREVARQLAQEHGIDAPNIPLRP
jgi:hypothetical protein